MVRLRLAVLLALPCAVSAQTADEKKATVGYLRSFEAKGGGFLPSPKAAAPSLRATSSALRSLRYFGGAPGDLDGARRFVLSCRDPKSGGFADTPGGKPDVAVTAVGLMAMVELKYSNEKYEKAAIEYFESNARQFEQYRMAAAGLEAIGKTCGKNKEWLAELAERRNADGTFGKGASLARDTGGAVACVLRLGGEVADPKAVVKALDAAQNDDGCFGGDLDTSYRVMRTYHMLKAKPKRAGDLRAYIARCRNADGGYGVRPGVPSSGGGTYFAGIILHWLGEK